MDTDISNNVTEADLKEVYDGTIPKHHPDHYIAARLRDKTVFVAKNNGTALGFLIYTIWWGNCPFIELIKVRKPYQRQGTGIALLKAAANDIQKQHFKTVISSSEVINEIGTNFHRRWGFKDLNVLELPHGQEQFYSIELENLV